MKTTEELTALSICLDFLARIIEATAWPFLGLTILLILQDPIKKLIGRIRKASFGGGELSFDEELQDVQNAFAEELKQEHAGRDDESERTHSDAEFDNKYDGDGRAPEEFTEPSGNGDLPEKRTGEVILATLGLDPNAEPMAMAAYFFKIAVDQPALAALGSWDYVQDAAHYRGFVLTPMSLRRVGFTNSETEAVIRLRALRNQLAHGMREITPLQANNYVLQAMRVLARIYRVENSTT